MIDEAGTVLAHGSDLEGGAPPGVRVPLAAFSADVDEQLQVVAAGHAFFGDRNDATLSFFAAHPERRATPARSPSSRYSFRQ